MEWARVKCDRINFEKSANNLRSQLAEMLDRIPFGKLTYEQFYQHTVTYDGFFNAEEIKAINQTILQRNQPSFDLSLISVRKRKRTLSPIRVFDCDRRESGSVLNSSCNSTTDFTSTATLMLTKFYMPNITGDELDELQYCVSQSGEFITAVTELIHVNQWVELTEPVY